MGSTLSVAEPPLMLRYNAPAAELPGTTLQPFEPHSEPCAKFPEALRVHIEPLTKSTVHRWVKWVSSQARRCRPDSGIVGLQSVLPDYVSEHRAAIAYIEEVATGEVIMVMGVLDVPGHPFYTPMGIQRRTSDFEFINEPERRCSIDWPAYYAVQSPYKGLSACMHTFVAAYMSGRRGKSLVVFTPESQLVQILRREFPTWGSETKVVWTPGKKLVADEKPIKWELSASTYTFTPFTEGGEPVTKPIPRYFFMESGSRGWNNFYVVNMLCVPVSVLLSKPTR